MKFKAIVLHPLVIFLFGVAVGVGGFWLKDYNEISQQIAPTRAAVAPRAVPATLTPRPTAPPTEIAESNAAPDSSNGNADATPTLEPTPTETSALLVTFTPITTITATRTAPRVTATARVTTTATTVAKPKGDSPFTAIEINGTWDVIGPKQQVWYRTGYATVYPLRGSIALDAYGKDGIGFAVFGPEQAQNLRELTVVTTPKGRGAHDKATPSHDLIWTGGSPNAGVWYVLVTNANSVPVDYKLISTFNPTDPKNCYQYYETMSNGVYILWTECNRPKAP